MKKIVLTLVFIAFSCMSIMAQDFFIEEGKIKWQKIINEDANIKDIHKAMVMSYDFMNVNLYNDFITAEIKPVRFKSEDYGMKWGNTPTVLSNGAIGPIFIIVEVKEGRYRITASHIRITSVTQSSNYLNGAFTELEEIVMTDDVFNDSMEKTYASVFGKFLDGKLNFKLEEEEW